MAHPLTWARVALGHLALLAALAVPVGAQPVLNSAAGSGAVVLAGSGLLTADFSDARLRLDYVDAVSTSPWRLGAGVSLEAQGGFAPLIRKGGFDVGGAGASAYAAYKVEQEVGDSAEILHFPGLEVAYTRAIIALADPAGATRTEETLNGLSATASYYAFSSGVIDVLISATLGYGQRHNSADLDEVEVCTTLGEGVSSDGPTAVVTCEDALAGTFTAQRATFGTASALVYPGVWENRFGLGAFVRHDGARANATVPGVAVVLTKPGSPLRILGALTGEWRPDGLRLGLKVGVPF